MKGGGGGGGAVAQGFEVTGMIEWEQKSGPKIPQIPQTKNYNFQDISIHMP